jgi:tetratricopeptide (TPR) repeat protein
VAHEAQWLGSIGEALWKFDQPEDAVQAIQQAIAAARRVNDVDLQAGMLSLLGQIHLSDRQAEAAAGYYGQALDLYRSLGRTDEEVSTLSSLGTIAMDADRTTEAIQLYGDALDIAARSGQRAAAVRLYGRLARLAQRRGDTDASLDALTQAVDIAETIDQPALLNQAYQHLAVAQDSANRPEALDTYERALQLSREVGDEYGETLMLVNVGARILANGERRDATEILEHATRMAADLGVVGEKLLQRARGLLAQSRGVARPAGTPTRTAAERARLERRPAQRPSAAPPASEMPAGHITPIASELQQNAGNHAQPR